MSMFYDEFDRLQDTVNALMGDFSQRRGRGGRQQRRGQGKKEKSNRTDRRQGAAIGGGNATRVLTLFGVLSAFPCFVLFFLLCAGGWMDPLGMFDEDWMTAPLTTAPLLTGDVGSTGSLLPAGGKGLEESKMDESAAGGQLTTTGGEQRVGLPTLRCRVNVEDQKDKLVVTAEGQARKQARTGCVLSRCRCLFLSRFPALSRSLCSRVLRFSRPAMGPRVLTLLCCCVLLCSAVLVVCVQCPALIRII